MTTATQTAAPKCAAPKGFTMPCPCCGEPAASVSVRLAQLDDRDAAFHCAECDAEFGVAFVRELIGRWTKVLAWVDNIPQFEDE